MTRDEIKELECASIKLIIAKLEEGECPSGVEMSSLNDAMTTEAPMTTEAASSDDDDDDDDKRVLIEALKRKLIASYKKREEAIEAEELEAAMEKASALRKLNRKMNELNFNRQNIVDCVEMTRDEIKDLECAAIKDIIAKLEEGVCPSGVEMSSLNDVMTTEAPMTTEAASSDDDDDDDKRVLIEAL